MAAKYQIYKDKAGKFRFRLVAENGRTIATGEAYERRTSCINGIESIKKNIDSPVEDTTTESQKIPFPKYKIFKDKAGEFRFNLSASNGEVIATSEGYSSKEGCLNGISSIQRIGKSEIEDLTIEPEDKAELPNEPEPEPELEPAVTQEPIVMDSKEAKEEEKIQVAMPIAAAPVVEETKTKNEVQFQQNGVSRIALMVLAIGLVVGVILVAIGLGFAGLGGIFGTTDAFASSVMLLFGEIIVGASIIFLAKK